MTAPSLGRRRVIGLLVVLLAAMYFVQVEAVPTGSQRPLPEWIDGLWSKLRSGYDTVSGYSEYVDKKINDALVKAKNTVVQSVRDWLSLPRGRRASPTYYPHPGTLPTDVYVHRFVGLDGNVLSHLKNFPSPQQPATMKMFEHRGLIFWFVTETFTDADGAPLQGRQGRVHVYAVRGRQMMSTVVDTKGAVKCEPVLLSVSFVDFVCAERLLQHMEAKKNGSGVYRMTWRGKLEVTWRRPLPTYSARGLQVWHYKQDTLIAFLNAPELKILHGGPKVNVQLTSHVFRHKSAVVDGVLFTSYNRLEKGSFFTTHPRDLAALVIGTRTFLAVANYMGKDGNTETHSDIFVFEQSSTRLFQRIRTSAARSWAAFTFRSQTKEEHFLVVANEFTVNAAGIKNYQTDSMIYKFYRNKFVPFQCIQTVAAREWVAYQGPKGDFLLAVVSGQSGVFFYQYNGWRFIQMPIHIRKTGIKNAWMGFLPVLNRAVLTLTDRDNQRPLVLYLKFEEFQPSVTEEEELKWCLAYRGRLGKDPHEVLTRIQAAPRRDQPFNFPQPLRINSNLLLAPGNVVSSIGMIIVRNDGYKVDHSFSLLSANLEEIGAAFARLARARAVLASSLKINGPNLNGFRFDSLKFQCTGSGDGSSGCKINNLVANKINGQTTSLGGLIWLNRDQELQNISFAHTDLGAGVSASVTFLSGHDLPTTRMADLVTLLGNHSITGHKDFGIIRVNHLFVSGTINKIHVDKASLLLKDEEQSITTDFTMRSLSVKNIHIRTLNGRDLASFLQQLVLNNTDMAITGHLIVRGEVIARTIHTTQPAKPVDPREVARRALLHSIQDTQVITGLHTLGGLSVDGPLRIMGNINGLSIPKDVYLGSHNESVSQRVTFNSVQANSVQVLGRLADIRVINGQLDVLLLHGNQQVSGKKVFADIMLLDHSSVALTVSGYRLQDLENTVIDGLKHGLESGRKIIGEVRFEAAVQVKDVVLGGANITHIFLNALPLHTTSIPSTFIFEAPVKIVGDTRVTDHLNGKRIDLYALLAGTHVFSRRVSFTLDVVMEGNVNVAKTVNGINIRELSGIMALTDAPTVTIVQDITLHNPSLIGGLQLRPGGTVVVGGVDLQDLVLRDTDAVITGMKTFTSVRVESSVSAGRVVVTQGGQVNGIILEDLFFGNSLRKSVNTLQHLVGRSLAVVAVPSITGTRLAAFERSVVYRDSSSERLAGSLVFTGPVSIQDLTFGGKFDGVSAEEYKSGWLMKMGDQVLTGHNVIQNLNVLEFTFTGRSLQGVDFERLVKNTAKIDEITILHSVAFGRLLSNAGVIVNGTVQGLKLSDEALTTTAATQVVTGKKVFQAAMHYQGEFSIDQHVVVISGPDDTRPLAINIEELCAAMMTVPAASTRIRRWIIQGDVRFERNVTVLDTFNGESVATLGTAFWFTHVPTTIAAVAFIASLDTRGKFNIDVGKINGQSLEEVWKQLLKRSCEAQTVTGQLTIHSLSLEHLATPRLTNPNDDLRVTDFLNVLLQDGDQVITGPLNFASIEAQDVALEGTLNGLRMDTDFVLYERQAVITAKKTFAHLSVLGNMSMVDKGTIQGVDVSELARLVVVRANEGQVIIFPGTTILSSLVYTGSHFQVVGRVDGVFLRPDTVLLRTGEQVMTGTLEVMPASPVLPAVEAGMLVVVDNRFNDVDLNRLVNRTVHTDRRITIKHSVTFSGVCRFNSVIIASHMINGINIQELADLINTDYLISLGDHIGAALHAARTTREVLAVKGASIWYYEELPFETVARVIPVMLRSAKLEMATYDALVGLDMTTNHVYVYAMDVPFPRMYPAIRVLEPMAVAGLGSGLLATCGRQTMEAIPAGAQPMPHFTTIDLGGGTGTGYGHIYSLTSGVGLLTAFETRECTDLVSFPLPDGRVCVAVLNYHAATTLVCGTASTGFHLMGRLDTTRAMKGVWVTFADTELLIIAQEPSQTEMGVLEAYGYNSALGEMTLMAKAHEPVSTHVTAAVFEEKVVVAVTGKRTAMCDTFVEVFTSNTSLVGQDVQRLEVPDAVHSHLIHLHTGEVVLMVQTRHSLYHYHMRGTKFVFVKQIKTRSSLHPWSMPFLAGDPKTLLIAHSGLGAYQEDYKGAKLLPVPTTIYRAVYRGPSFTPLYRGTSHISLALHAGRHTHPPPSSSPPYKS